MASSYDCNICLKQFDTKQKLAIHQKGRGVRCAYKQIVPSFPSVPSLLDSHGSKRAASPDASSNTQPQRKRANEALDLHVEEINVMDIHEDNGPGYQLDNDEEDDKIDSGLSYYRTFQEALYNEVFTEDCLKCTNLDDFKNLLKANGISPSRERDDGAMSLFTALKSVPRSVGDQILSILPQLGCINIPKKWETLKRQLHKKVVALYKHKEYDFEWPENWKITDQHWKTGKPPACMKVLINDPLQQIALLLVDPRFMFLFKNQIKLKAELHETGKITDFMSTQLAHDTQEKLWNDRGFHGNKIYADYERDIVIALKLYEDGVSMGWGGAASTIAVMGGILNCDIDLQRRDISKFVIGYIDNLTTVSEEVITAHLIGVMKMSITGAKEELRWFHRKLENFFKEKVYRLYQIGLE